MIKQLGGLALLRLLVRAIATHASHQAEIARELKTLNRFLRERFPVPAVPAVLPGEVPAASQEFDWALDQVQDARDQLHRELGREASDEQVLERLLLLRERTRITYAAATEVLPKGAPQPTPQTDTTGRSHPYGY